MTFTESVGKCLRKYGTFHGRATRSEYWWFTFLVLLFAWPLLLTSFGGDQVTKLLSFVYFTLTLLVLIPYLAVWTRRMHDVNKKGWSWLYIFIPIIGWIVILRRLTRQGKNEANKYGNPEGKQVAHQSQETPVENGSEKSPKDVSELIEEPDPEVADEVFESELGSLTTALKD